MKCPPIDELSPNSFHIQDCDSCHSLLVLREGERIDSQACDSISPLLSLYQSGILTQEDSNALDAHLQSCPACLRSLLIDLELPASSDNSDKEYKSELSDAMWRSPQITNDEVPRRLALPISAVLLVAAALLLMLRWSASNPETVARLGDGGVGTKPGRNRSSTLDAGVKDASPVKDTSPAKDAGRNESIDASEESSERRPRSPGRRSPSTSRTIEDIRIVFAKAEPAFSKCFETHHSVDRGGMHPWQYYPEISPSGKIEQGRSRGPLGIWGRGSPSQGFMECVVKKLKTMRFGSNDTATKLRCEFRRAEQRRESPRINKCWLFRQPIR